MLYKYYLYPDNQLLKIKLSLWASVVCFEVWSGSDSESVPDRQNRGQHVKRKRQQKLQLSKSNSSQHLTDSTKLHSKNTEFKRRDIRIRTGPKTSAAHLQKKKTVKTQVESGLRLTDSTGSVRSSRCNRMERREEEVKD